MEYARIDFLSPAERSIYLRNKIYDPDEDLEISDEVRHRQAGRDIQRHIDDLT